MGATSFAVTELLGGVLGGGGLVKLATWWASRKSGRLGALYDQLDRADQRLVRHEKRMDEMDKHLEECREHKDSCEEDLAEVRREIDKLMSGGVPPYRAKPPRTT